MQIWIKCKSDCCSATRTGGSAIIRFHLRIDIPSTLTLKACIICLATKDKRYPEGLERLKKSIRASGFPGDILCWKPGHFPAGCPSHKEVPFAFKPWCFREAGSRGMELVLWLDASCVVLRNLAPVFREIEKNGFIIFHNNPHRVGQWISDEALEVLGIEREKAMRMPEISAAAIGLNLKNSTAREFLRRWLGAAEAEVAFRGTRQRMSTNDEYLAMKFNRDGKASGDSRVYGHRHDQSVAGVIAHQLRMKPTAGGFQIHSARHRWIRTGTVIAVDRSLNKKGVTTWSYERVRRDRYIGAFAQLLNIARNVWR